MPLLVVVCLAMIAAVAYPFSTGEPLGTEERFSQHSDDEYRLSAAIETDGEPTLSVDGAVSATGESYVRTVESSVVDERYQDGEDDVVYRRVLIDETSSSQSGTEQYLTRIEDDPDEMLVRENTSEGRTEIITKLEAPDSTVDDRLRGGGSVVTETLAITAYDPIGTTEGQSTLAPTDGWFDEDRPYRIAGSDGEVRVVSGTNAVYEADVRWQLTTGVSSYAEYLLTDETHTQRITYEYEADDVDVEIPEWVESNTN